MVEKKGMGRMWALSGGLLLAAGCADDGTGVGSDFGSQLNCTIAESEIFNGGPGKDGIPALTDPEMVPAGDPDAAYLRDDDRVIGLLFGEEVLAVPLNILWWHEIVNLNLPGHQVAVTHCPLTGSSMAFDRSTVGGAELGVSGLLYRNNLIMYDRTTQESLWPQMLRGARCGAATGQSLPMEPVVEMSWEGWRTLHPETKVVSSNTGAGRNYQSYPYGNYDQVDNPQLLFPLARVDERRPPKERVLGIPMGNGGQSFPFGELASLGSMAVVESEGDVVFWDGAREAAMAYSRTLEDGSGLTFQVVDGDIRDKESLSVWNVEGLAVSGPLAGTRLAPVPEAYVAYWFAWAAFHPDTDLWEAS
jgi:hypothetical protein